MKLLKSLITSLISLMLFMPVTVLARDIGPGYIDLPFSISGNECTLNVKQLSGPTNALARVNFTPEKASFDNATGSFTAQLYFEQSGNYELEISVTNQDTEDVTYDRSIYNVKITNTGSYQEGGFETEWELTKDGEPVNDKRIVFNNYNGKFPVVLSYKRDANFIQGSETEIVDSNGNVVETWKSANSVYSTELEPGEYTLHEVTTPRTYLPLEDLKLIVDDSGTITAESELVAIDGNKVKIKRVLENEEPETTVEETPVAEAETKPEPAKTSGSSVAIPVAIGCICAAGGVAWFIIKKKKK